MRLMSILVAACVVTSVQASPLTTRLDKLRVKHKLSGILAARVENGEISELAASGCAYFALNGSCARKLTPDHFVRVASISKLVAALGVKRLVEQGKLDLDADVSNYLGFKFRNPAFPQKNITTRMLLAHTSSLRDNEVYWVDFPGMLDQLLDDEGRFDSANAPGSYFKYCNLNYGMIGQIIERVSGVRFDVFMRKQVFEPRGIIAGYNWSGMEKVPGKRVAVLYRKKQDDTAWNPDGPWFEQIDDFDGRSPMPKGRGYDGDPKSYKPGTNGTLFSPQGGLRISLRGLASLTAYMASTDDPVLRDMLKPVWTYKKDNGDTEGDFFKAYASGAQIYKGGAQAFPSAVPAHFADAYGLRGGLFFDPAKKQGWIYLITGFSDEPSKGPKPAGCAYPGLAPAEADALCAVWRGK